MSEKIQVIIEVCSNCKSHQWCTRHKQGAYTSVAQQLSKEIKSKNNEIQVKIVPVSGNKIGSFEVICKGKILFSKLTLGYFPTVSALALRLLNFIEDVKNKSDLRKYDPGMSSPIKSNTQYDRHLISPSNKPVSPSKKIAKITYQHQYKKEQKKQTSTINKETHPKHEKDDKQKQNQKKNVVQEKKQASKIVENKKKQESFVIDTKPKDEKKQTKHQQITVKNPDQKQNTNTAKESNFLLTKNKQQTVKSQEVLIQSEPSKIQASKVQPSKIETSKIQTSKIQPSKIQPKEIQQNSKLKNQSKPNQGEQNYENEQFAQESKINPGQQNASQLQQ